MKVDLRNSKPETTMLGAPTIFPQRFSLRARAQLSTKADIDQTSNYFIGQPSTFQGLDMLISALGPLHPAV